MMKRFCVLALIVGIVTLGGNLSADDEGGKGGPPPDTAKLGQNLGYILSKSAGTPQYDLIKTSASIVSTKPAGTKYYVALGFSNGPPSVWYYSEVKEAIVNANGLCNTGVWQNVVIPFSLPCYRVFVLTDANGVVLDGQWTLLE